MTFRADFFYGFSWFKLIMRRPFIALIKQIIGNFSTTRIG